MPTKIEWATEYVRNKLARVIRDDGYALVRCPSYPRSNRKGYVLEHRVVKAIEIGRPLLTVEVVHHKNKNRLDNRPANLQLMLNGRHVSQHQRQVSKSLKAARTKMLNDFAALKRQPRQHVLCECGCGEIIETPDQKGRRRRFAHGHNQRWRHWEWQTKQK